MRYVELAIVSGVISFVVSTSLMRYHIQKVNKLIEKYMDFESSSVEKFAKDVIDKLPRNSARAE